MVIKRCTRCNKLKHFIQFSKGRDEYGLNYACKVCVNNKSREHYKNNKERKVKLVKEYRKNNKEWYQNYKKQYYLDNKEKIDKRNKEWDIKNREKRLIYIKEYDKKHKDRITIRKKQYYKDNKERLTKQKRQYRINNRKKINLTRKLFNNAFAKFDSYNNKLTVDEASRLASDGVSLEVKCRYCGRYFIPCNSVVTQRLRALNGTTEGDCFLYCSDNCKEACPVYNQNKFPKGFKKVSSREVNPLVRQICFERDNWTCQICGASQQEAPLHCHHLEGVAQNPRLGNDVKNTITLCKACHREVHELPGCNYYELKCKKE